MNIQTKDIFKQANIDYLTKSLERVSIYDGRGKASVLQISPKADYLRILGDLNLETINEQMENQKQLQLKILLLKKNQ